MNVAIESVAGVLLCVVLWSLVVVCELSMSAICMQGWFHCRGEDKPDALIGAGVARQQMSSRLGGGLPVEEGEREIVETERVKEKWRWEMMEGGK